jgi:hypothetical protein
MAQIQKGDTFADGQQVTGARLNQLLDSATLLPNAITDQASNATGVSGDFALIYKNSVMGLRKIDIGNLFSSNNAVTTSAITAGANSDITLNTLDGAIVNTGVTYASANGTNVTITTPTAHGLVVGQIVSVTSAGTGYNGTFKITAVPTIPNVPPFTFSYVMQAPATPTTGTPSCAYTRQGAVRNNEHEVIAGNLYVDGTTFVNTLTNNSGTLPISGNVTVGGAVNVGGDLNAKNIKVIPTYHYWRTDRSPAIYNSVIKQGGAQDPTNLWGTEITQMTLNFTPKATGHTIIIQWNVHGELSPNPEDGVWLATRQVAGGTEEPIKSYTIVNGVQSGATPNLSVNDNNDTWSGITSTVYDANSDDTTPNQNVIKIIDGWSSNLNTTYRLRLRMSSNLTNTFYYNRAMFSFSALSNEWGVSTAHAQEICTTV